MMYSVFLLHHVKACAVPWEWEVVELCSSVVQAEAGQQTPRKNTGAALPSP